MSKKAGGDALTTCGPLCDRQHEVDEPHNENYKPFDPGPVPATAEEVAAERAASNRAAQQSDDDVAAPADTKPYLVTGKQRLNETSPGEVVHLNPEAPQTQRLIARGQIQPVDITEGDE